MNPENEDMATKKTKTPSATTGPKVMDIAKPGTLKSTTATARPVIVSNRPLIQDPMVKEDTGSSAAEPTSSDTPAKEKLVIRPLMPPEPTTDDKQLAKGMLDIPIDAAADSADTDTSDTADAGAPADKAVADAEPKLAAGEKADVQPNTEDDKVTDSKSLDAARLTAEEEARAKADAELDELIERKEYFLPINAAEHRRSRVVVVIGVILIVILVLAWLDVALDAGLIAIPGVQPVTHFFN